MKQKRILLKVRNPFHCTCEGMLAQVTQMLWKLVFGNLQKLPGYELRQHALGVPAVEADE